MNRGAVVRSPNVDKGHTEMLLISQADLPDIPPDSWADLPDSWADVLKINQEFSWSLCVLLRFHVPSHVLMRFSSREGC